VDSQAIHSRRGWYQSVRFGSPFPWSKNDEAACGNVVRQLLQELVANPRSRRTAIVAEVPSKRHGRVLTMSGSDLVDRPVATSEDSQFVTSRRGTAESPQIGATQEIAASTHYRCPESLSYAERGDHKLRYGLGGRLQLHARRGRTYFQSHRERIRPNPKQGGRNCNNPAAAKTFVGVPRLMPSIGEVLQQGWQGSSSRKRRTRRCNCYRGLSASGPGLSRKPGCILGIRPNSTCADFSGSVDPNRHGLRSKRFSPIAWNTSATHLRNARRNRTKPEKCFAKALMATTGVPLRTQKPGHGCGSGTGDVEARLQWYTQRARD